METARSEHPPRTPVPLLLGAIAWSTLAVLSQGSEPLKAAGLAAVAALLLLSCGLPTAAALRPLAALAIAGCACTCLALEPWAALTGSQARAMGFVSLGAGLVLATHAARLTDAQRTRLHAGCSLLAGLVAGYVLAQRFGLDPWSWHGADPLRPAATLGNASVLAGWLLLTLPLCAALAWARCSWVWGSLAGLQLAALLASGTRSAWVGLVAMVLWLLWRRCGWRRVLAPLLALALVGSLLLAWRPASVADRARLWPAAAAAWLQPGALPDLFDNGDALRPARRWLGYGPDQQRAPLDAALAAATQVRSGATGWDADRAHQWLLDGLLQWGAFGLAAWCWLLVAVVATLRRALAEPGQVIEARALAVALGAWMLHQQFAFALNADQALALLLAGCALGLRAQPVARTGLPAGMIALPFLACSVAMFVNGRWPWTEVLAPALAAETSFARGQADYAAALAAPDEIAHLRQAASAFERAAGLRRYDRDAALAAASSWVEVAVLAADPIALAKARRWTAAVAAITPADARLERLRARIEAAQARIGSGSGG
ncbi:MAG: hypothetical protein IT479_15420 [Xanthomonadales bacterium]|nr:hypothetical protein [Xanthomonadales bacterium]MCC6594651.1 hypothetical protein [Xanthomonadales bacterium]